MAALILAIILAAVSPHHHPTPLPTDPATWNSCCHDYDCREAKVSVRDLRNGFHLAQIADFAPVRIKSSNVHVSQNGKTYFCTAAAELPPTDKNILCVFIMINLL